MFMVAGPTMNRLCFFSTDARGPMAVELKDERQGDDEEEQQGDEEDEQ